MPPTPWLTHTFLTVHLSFKNFQFDAYFLQLMQARRGGWGRVGLKTQARLESAGTGCPRPQTAPPLPLLPHHICISVADFVMVEVHCTTDPYSFLMLAFPWFKIIHFFFQVSLSPCKCFL